MSQEFEQFLKKQQPKKDEIALDAYQRVSKQETEIQKLREAAKTARPKEGFVGPARPLPGAEYSESSSSSDDEDADQNALMNDPIFRMAMTQKKVVIPKVNTESTSSSGNPATTTTTTRPIAEDDSSSSEDDDEEQVKPSGNETINSNGKRVGPQQQQQSLDSTSNLQALFPLSLEASLKGHQKRVTTLTIDQSGSRLVSGSNDYHMRLWDFNGMNQSMNSFRVLEPLEGHPLKSLSFNANSQTLLAVGGGPQICLVSRDGRKGNVSVKGDMYITDMAKTKGHVSSVNTGMFHPVDYNIFATGSSDSTVRIWDLEKKLAGIEQQMTHVNLIKCTDQKGTKAEVDKLQYSKDGRMILIGTKDGSLQVYSTAQCHRPAYCMRGAHGPGEEYGGLKFFSDGVRLASRSCDGTLKLWDLRNFKKPVSYVDNLPSYAPGSSVCMSPDEKYLVTGCSTSKHITERDSFLYFYDASTLDEVAKVKVGQESITDMLWHPTLNQIIFGTGDNISIYFDQKLSKKGALNCISKRPRQVTLEDLHNNRPIISPHALPLFKEKTSFNPEKQYKKSRLDPIVSHKPEQPQQGPGKAGRIGKSSTVTQFIMNTLNSAPSNREDAQEALLMMQEKAEKNPLYISNAYKDTQPVAVLDVEDRVKELEEQKYLSKLKEICPSCGLKICTCKERFKFDYK